MSQKSKTFNHYVVDFFNSPDAIEEFESKQACATRIAEVNKLNLSIYQIRRMATEVGRYLDDLEEHGGVDVDVEDPDVEDPDVESGPKVTIDENRANGTAGFSFQGKLDRPMTIDEAISAYGVDLEIWDIERVKVNNWGMTSKIREFNEGEIVGEHLEAAKNYQITAWLKKKAEDPTKTFQNTLDKFDERYKDFKPRLKTILNRPKSGDKAAVINLYDAHLDKISAVSTTGVAMTMQDNIDIYNTALEEMCEYLEKQKPEMIVYPLGNDLFHTNDFDGHTKKGTRLESMGDEVDAMEAIIDVAIESIDRLRQIAPVHVIMIHGNHDYHKICSLSKTCRLMFQNCEDVTIDGDRRSRKYFRWGKSLLGFAHGDKQKSKILQVPQMMAQETKKDWGETKYRHFYCGDLHHHFTVGFPSTKDYIGVEVEFLRSVGGNDTWHADNGYIGVQREGSVHMWSKNRGRRHIFQVPMDDDDDDE